MSFLNLEKLSPQPSTFFWTANPGWDVKPAEVPPFLHCPVLPLPLDGETAGKG